MFTMSYDVGPLGALILLLMAVPAAIVLYWLFVASRQARRDALGLEEEPNEPSDLG